MDDSEDSPSSLAKMPYMGSAQQQTQQAGNRLTLGARRASYKDIGATLSVAAPDSAAKIRSTVTGALRHDPHTGFFSFETVVETTFVLPWDLNPRVEPERFSEKLRNGIRSELLDATALSVLEAGGCLNWNTCVSWSVKDAQSGLWIAVDGDLFVELERLYHTADNECTLRIGAQGTVNFAQGFLQVQGGGPQQLRRLECSPLMPLKVDVGDGYSLFHAASMGFWGVHDRTNVLRDAVLHSLQDMKAQFVVFKRWCEQRQYVAALQGMPSESPSAEQWEEAKQTTPQLYVFSLANVTQRPIIVYAPPQCSVGGIYLPLLWKNQTTNRYPCDLNPQLKNPLVLGYDSSRNHFVPLVTFKGVKGPNLILLPLVHSDHQRLPVHYLTSEEVPLRDQLVQQLLNVHIHESSDPSIFVAPGSPVKASLPTTLHSQKGLPAATAVLDTPALPEVLDTLVKRFESLFL